MNAAEILYGPPPTAPAQEAAEAPLHAVEVVGPVEAEVDRATRLYGALDAEDDVLEVEVTLENLQAGMPVEIAEERASRQGIAPELAAALPVELFVDEDVGLDAELAQTIAVEMQSLAADAGMTAADVHLIADAIASQPFTEDDRIAGRESAVTQLNARYGRGARQALLDARAFVGADPRRAALLQHAGDNPGVVLRVTELAAAAKHAEKFPFQPSIRKDLHEL